MSSKPNTDCWAFIIDTDTYAGNFERELCAHITGHIGDCGVGDDFVESGIELRFKTILQIPDDRGCYRPCSIWPTPGYLNNGMGFGYKPGQEKEALEALKKSYLDYADHMLKVYAHSPETAIRESDRWKKKAEEAIEPGAYECCNSVIIYFESKPSKKQVQIMKERASSFTEKFNKYSFKIERFRLAQFKQVVEYKDL